MGLSQGEAEHEFARQLSRARDGCPQAAGELLQACQRFLLYSANLALASTLRPKKAASDLVQDTFLVAHQELADFRGSTLEEFTAWLHTILLRRLLNHSRAFRDTACRQIGKEISFDQASDLPDREPAGARDVELADEYARVAAGIQRLPPIYREVIELRAWQDLKFAEIAERMQKSTQAVEKLWCRAVERLGEELRAP